MTLKTALCEFITKKTLNGLSKATLTDYKDFISRFIRYTENIQLEQLTEKIVDNYIYDLIQNHNLTRATQGTYVRHLKVFLRWCEKKYNIDVNAKEIVVPKSRPKNPRIYSPEEIQQIFTVALNKYQWTDYRNMAIIALMLDSGLRRHEIVNLRFKDFDYENRVINVHGKGDKERFVPLGIAAEKLINQYLSVRPSVSNHEFVFITKDKEPINDNSIKLFINKIAQQLPFEFGCHRLRHNFGTNFLLDQYEEKGLMDIYALMNIMGHEDVSTTRGYLHIANSIIYSRQHISHIDRLSLNI